MASLSVQKSLKIVSTFLFAFVAATNRLIMYICARNMLGIVTAEDALVGWSAMFYAYHLTFH